MNPIDKLHYSKHQLKKGLEQFVKYAWIMKSTEAQSKQDLLIADGYSEIIFVQKGAYHKEFLSPNNPPVIINQSCVIGIQTQSVLASRMNSCHLIGLKLSPLGAYTLFGDRLKNIVDTNIPLEDFGIKWLCDLNESLQKHQEEKVIIDLLSNTLHVQVTASKNTQANDLIPTFLASILKAKGQISVQNLAQQHGISIRHFQRKFKTFFGITPKKFLNIIRFKHLYKSSILQQKFPINYLGHGYYDQMHFIKDFKKHLGVNPSKSLEEAFRQMNQIAKLSS